MIDRKCFAIFGCRSSGDYSNNKKPATRNGFKDATTDPAKKAEIKKRHSVIGISCIGSGVVAIDVDVKTEDKAGNPLKNKNGDPVCTGFDELNKLCDDYDLDHPGVCGTWTQDTPSGGRHYLFKVPEGIEINNAVLKKHLKDECHNLDVRYKGYICTGKMSTGEEYKITNDVEPIECPRNWLDVLTTKPKRKTVSATSANPTTQEKKRPLQNQSSQDNGTYRKEYITIAIEGKAEQMRNTTNHRNAALNTFAFTLAGQFLHEDTNTPDNTKDEIENQIWEALRSAASDCQAAGWEDTDQQIEKTIRSGITAGRNAPYTPPIAVRVQDDTYPTQTTANALSRANSPNSTNRQDNSMNNEITEPTFYDALINAANKPKILSAFINEQMQRGFIINQYYKSKDSKEPCKVEVKTDAKKISEEIKEVIASASLSNTITDLLSIECENLLSEDTIKFTQGKPITNRPVINYIIEEKLAAGMVAILAGKGGVGKSTWAIELAFCIANGLEIFTGKNPTPASIKKAEKLELIGAQKTLYLSYEDDDQVFEQRLYDIRKKYKKRISTDAEDCLHYATLDTLASDKAIITAANNGIIDTTQAYEKLKATILKEEPHLIILDTLSKIYSGNENDNQTASKFITALQEIIKALKTETGIQATILLIHHLSKDGDFRGASALVAESRLAIKMRAVDRYGEFIITDSYEKSNYSSPHSWNMAFYKSPEDGQQTQVKYEQVKELEEALTPVRGEKVPEKATREEKIDKLRRGIIKSIGKQGKNNSDEKTQQQLNNARYEKTEPPDVCEIKAADYR